MHRTKCVVYGIHKDTNTLVVVKIRNRAKSFKDPQEDEEWVRHMKLVCYLYGGDKYLYESYNGRTWGKKSTRAENYRKFWKIYLLP